MTACGNKRSPRRTVYSASAVPVTRTLSPLPVRPLSPKLQAVRASVMQTTAATRELEWKGEVGMTELSGWEYGTRAKEVAEALGGDELRSLSKLAIAGGMLPEGTDLATLAASFTAASASATYSPFDKQVLLLADQHKDNSLLTHEFVHALQDQHFDLLKLLVARPYNFDRTEALFAVIEGDAMNVQRRVEGGEGWTRRSLEDVARQEDERFGEFRKELGALFPPLLTETFIFRYRDGVRFVETIRRSRGERGVDDLFSHPPASSEQILHPEKYLAGFTGPTNAGHIPREVHVNEEGFAESGWRLVTSTPLGEIGVRGLLMRGLPSRDAARAAAGWGGDRAYLFEHAGSAPLFIWKTAWDREEDALEFFRAYNEMHSKNGGQSSDVLNSSKERRMLWREDGRLTLVHRNGDAVIIMRGAEADINVALELARR